MTRNCHVARTLYRSNSVTISAVFFLLGCTRTTEYPTPATGPADVRALSFPVAWLAERIGGPAVNVTCILPVDEDPPTWRPTPEVISDTLGAILKYQDDIQKLQGSEAKRILDEARATLEPV